MATSERLLDRTVLWGRSRSDYFAGREAEMRDYLREHSDRFAVTLELADRLARKETPKAVLELGAEPWLFTQLLLERGLDVTTAAKQGGIWVEKRLRSPQRVVLAWADRRVRLDHHLFNVERDLWPFPDEAFDWVVCMELLEHLIYSPAHLLHEANRVLRPGGLVLLTTPNSLAARYLLAMVRGRSVHWDYSGYGAYGRHNREFTPDEVALILREANFEPSVETRTLATDRRRGLVERALLRLPSRRNAIFAVGRKVGPPRFALPNELYRSFDVELMRREGVEVFD